MGSLTNMLIAFLVALSVVVMMGANEPCPPALRVGDSYAQAKVACPDIATQAFDNDPGTGTTMYLCPSQHVVVVGSVRTGKVVALMLDVAQ